MQVPWPCHQSKLMHTSNMQQFPDTNGAQACKRTCACYGRPFPHCITVLSVLFADENLQFSQMG